MDYLSLITAFSMGLLGGAHCIAMCGGIIGALTISLKPDQYWQRLYLILSYNLGRILSYMLIALLFYQLVSSLAAYLSLGFMRIVAGLLLIAMGLYLANWWRGLVYLEKAGGFLWQYIQPMARSLMPVKSIPQAFLLGMIWGWLPCGLIYSALVYSATANNAYSAVLVMLGFALGTLPAVLLSGLLAERLLAIIQIQQVRIVMSILIIFFGVWTIVNSHGP